jgi:hypothetical protein
MIQLGPAQILAAEPPLGFTGPPERAGPLESPEPQYATKRIPR